MTGIAEFISWADWPYLIWLGIGVLIFAYVTGRRAVRNRLSDSWIQLQGTIEKTEVAIEHRGDVSVQVARLGYSYTYEGEYYAGYYTRDFMREKSAEEFIKTFPRGMPVTIRVHPRHPDRSVMRDNDNSSVAVAVALRQKH